MGLSLDGLASGLDTTALIDSLMQIEAAPQTLLQNKVSATETMVSALQSLNSRVASLAEIAQEAAAPQSLDLFSTTSSSDAVAATATAGASAGSIDVVVDQVAQAQVSVSAALSVWTEASFTLSANGTDTLITAASTSIDDVVSAVNGADAGVTATKVAAGNGQYRVQFTATESGAAGAFTLSTAAPLTDVKVAQDAELTLWAGTAAEQTITSASNTFTNLLPGVNITVSAASTSPVTVSIARDNEQAAKVAEDLVTYVSAVLEFISTNSAVTSGTGSASGGIFTGDSTARDLNQRIISATTMPVGGRSPSEIGISITRDGTVEFDAEKFQQALTDDPAFVEAALQEISSRVATVATAASDPYDGQITTRIQGQESLVDSMSDQILDWDRRLETRRSTLERIYASLEVQLSSLNAQSDWLTSQLGSLPAPKSS